jgi:hypothetical protein
MDGGEQTNAGKQDILPITVLILVSAGFEESGPIHANFFLEILE